MWPTDRDETRQPANDRNLRSLPGEATLEGDTDFRAIMHRLEELWSKPTPAPEFVRCLGRSLRREAVALDTQVVAAAERSAQSRLVAGVAPRCWLPHLRGDSPLSMGQVARNAAMTVMLLVVLGLGAAAYLLRPLSPHQTTLSLSGMAGRNNASASPPATAGSLPYALYATAGGKPATRLDPTTLTDLPQAPPLDVGEPYPNWVVSADGSVSARTESSGESRVIIIRSGLTGPERRRIQPTTTIFAQALNRDGTRLLTQETMGCGVGGCSAPVWYVYDTTSGRLISTVTGDDQGYGVMAFLDPSGRRLFRPEFARNGRPVGPWPLQIVAYDLTTATGREIRRLTLPNVPAGIWYDRAIDQVPVEESLTPGIALSPDGRTIAVVHADTGALTLIDAATLRVERTMPLTRPKSLGERLFAWLGLAPQSAAAKFMNGISLDAVFSTDGRTLYVYGTEGRVGSTKTDVSEQGLGLRAIDPATGVIVGEALTGQEIDQVIPAPDNRSVYVNGPSVHATAETGGGPDRLIRLAPRALDVLATRNFPDQLSVILIPRAP